MDFYFYDKSDDKTTGYKRRGILFVTKEDTQSDEQYDISPKRHKTTIKRRDINGEEKCIISKKS